MKQVDKAFGRNVKNEQKRLIPTMKLSRVDKRMTDIRRRGTISAPDIYFH